MNYTNTNGLKRAEFDFQDKKLIFETGFLANQATASVKVSLDGTSVLATLVSGKKKDNDFLPLQVVYEERFYSSGKIKDSLFNKREGKPSDEAVLTGRIIDRSLRSGLNKNIRTDLQIVVTCLEIDKVNKPDLIGVLASSLCLQLANFEYEQSIFKTQNPKIFMFWDYSKNKIISINTEIKDEKSLLNLANKYFTLDSFQIFITKAKLINDNIYVLISGISEKDQETQEINLHNLDSSIFEQMIILKKQYIIKPDFKSPNFEIKDNDIFTFSPYSKVIFQPISSSRIGLNSASLLKSYISAILKSIQNNPNLEFSEIKDTLGQIILNRLYSKEISDFIFKSLSNIETLAQEFKDFEERITKNNFDPMKNLLCDKEKLNFDHFPNYEEIENTELNLIISGSPDNITMVETGANILPKEIVIEGMSAGLEDIKLLCEYQSKFVEKVLNASN